MVENRPLQNVMTHGILILGIVVIIFPIYIAFVASTHRIEDALSTVHGWFGNELIENYTRVLKYGKADSVGAPVSRMMWNSLVMALGIVVGKISISILSAYAIVYFRFPFRRLFFWIIFMTLMLPVEVRILPTYKVVSDLGLLNTYTGLTLPLIASATATFLFRQFFFNGTGRTGRGRPGRRCRSVPFLSRCAAAAFPHQYSGVVCDSIHLRLEPVP